MNSKTDALFLGIDTSNYTTSLAVLDSEDNIIQVRERLHVKEGQRGLRQSEAVFEHIKNLPDLFEELTSLVDLKTLQAIAVSTRPRPVEDSYMPVFAVGESFAKSLAYTLSVPLFLTSHQENHLEAVRRTLPGEKDISAPFLAVHFSGGTSEILFVNEINNVYNIKRLASSLDLKAGQLLDRTGVKMGLAFPAGAELDALALTVEKPEIRIPEKLEGANFHFSGQENQVERFLNEGVDPASIARALLEMIARTLTKSILKLKENHTFSSILFSGGVMGSTVIQEQITKELEKEGLKAYFSSPDYSSDNAVGNAFLARRLTDGSN